MMEIVSRRQKRPYSGHEITTAALRRDQINAMRFAFMLSSLYGVDGILDCAAWAVVSYLGGSVSNRNATVIPCKELSFFAG